MEHPEEGRQVPHKTAAQEQGNPGYKEQEDIVEPELVGQGNL